MTEDIERRLYRPSRQQVEDHLDDLITEFIFTAATRQKLEEVRMFMISARFMGYNMSQYDSLYKELESEFPEYAGIQIRAREWYSDNT